MKYIATIILLLITPMAFAKGTAEALTTAGPGTGTGFPHFTPNGGGDAVNKTVNLRLIAKTYLTHNGSIFIPHDSTTYSYANGRGGVPDIDYPAKDDNILFNESFYYNFDKQYGNYVPSLHRTQTFGQNKSVLSLVYARWKENTSTWKDSIRYLYAYNNGKMVSSTLDRWLGNIWANSITSSMEYNGDVVTKMNSDLYEVNFSYDANNNLTMVSDKELTPGGWQNKEKRSYEYLNKDIIKYTLEKWDAAANTWVNSKKWEYTYTGPDVKTEVESDWNGSDWVVYGKHQYTYDGSHNKTTDIWQINSNGNFQNDTKTDWVYNSQNLPEKITTTTWSGSAWVYTGKDFEYHYYYETYFPESVKDNLASGAEINLFPVPAHNVLHVALTTARPEPLQLSVCNMQGIVVAQWEEQSAPAFDVPVTNLPAGQYMLKVSGQHNTLARSFVVVH